MKLHDNLEIVRLSEAGRIVDARRLCAVLWGFVLAFALAATLLHDPRGVLMSFAAAVVTTLLTVGLGKPARDERLERPRLYRVIAWTLLGVALFGVGLAFAPHASETSKIVGVFFGGAALLAYRCAVTRGSRAAVWTVVIAMWTWVPFAFITLTGCRLDRREPHWTEVVSLKTLYAFELLLPVLAIGALVAFTPRRDHVPDARVVSR